MVRDKETLAHLSRCRTAGAGMLAKADCAIVVVADEAKCDVWIEDCSIAMANMHLMADALGLGSCWVQGRLRTAPDGRDTEDYIRSLLHYPEGYRLEAMLSLAWRLPIRLPAPWTPWTGPRFIRKPSDTLHAPGYTIGCIREFFIDLANILLRFQNSCTIIYLIKYRNFLRIARE